MSEQKQPIKNYKIYKKDDLILTRVEVADGNYLYYLGITLFDGVGLANLHDLINQAIFDFKDLDKKG